MIHDEVLTLAFGVARHGYDNASGLALDFTSVFLEISFAPVVAFNDDIQGTAAVVFGALLAAIKASGGSLQNQRIVFCGAGAAAIGVADYLRMALVDSSLSEEQARSRIWIVNRGGILRTNRTT